MVLFGHIKKALKLGGALGSLIAFPLASVFELVGFNIYTFIASQPRNHSVPSFRVCVSGLNATKILFHTYEIKKQPH